MKSDLRYLFLILVISVLANCKSDLPQTKPELIGKTQSQVLAKKGKPISTQEFKLGEGMNEYRKVLQDFYPLTDEKNKKIKVRELTWNKDNAQLTVWFHNINGTWRAFHKSEQPKELTL